jgi:SAM-dependent methyltransferase
MNTGTTNLLKQFKALSDPTRARLVALCGAAECSVSELTEVMRQSQPRISQHLKQLCAADLLLRFRDGHFVYYRAPADEGNAVGRRKLLGLLPDDEPEFRRDLETLRALRAGSGGAPADAGDGDRLLHKALVELTVARPLGDLLDVGCGQGKMLKLLASRAHRVIGVDIDPDARRLARAEVLLAGLPNCSLRQGDMYALPFADRAFDTIILDDILADAERPTVALAEALRLLRPGGRMLLLTAVKDRGADGLRDSLATWAAETGLRLAAPRMIPGNNPTWLLAVATRAAATTEAA